MQQSANPAPGFARNPDRKITVKPVKGTVTVKSDDVTVAASTEAQRLEEEGYDAVLYIPFKDISFANLDRTSTKTHCPYKGDASYWRLSAGAEPGEDIMWAYESPYDEMFAIKDHGAFYANRVTIGEG